MTMTFLEIAHAATERIGREVDVAFVRAVIDGDAFLFQMARNRDREAAVVVLGFASGRLHPDRQSTPAER